MSDQDRLAEAAALAEEIRERNRLVPDDDPRKVLLGHLDWLVGEVERLHGLLARLEWPETLPGAGPWHICPVCSNHRDQGHEDDCWLAAELHRDDEASRPDP